MSDRITWLFRQTAWPMAQPSAGSAFHLCLTSAGILCAVLSALFLAGRRRIRPEKILFFCGLILSLSELYKQGFLYFIVNDRHYNWWYFPFQLCSIPMYLCLLYPSVRRPCGRSANPAPARILATFLQDFGLLGGLMALAFPEGFLYSYWSLTLHGFFWHFLLVFIGVYCGRCGLADRSLAGFVRCLPIYAVCCLVASGINTAVQLTVYPASYADMFYINCFFPSEQPVFSLISLTFGNVWGHIAYMLASCLGAFLIHLLMRRFSGAFCEKSTTSTENMVE